jgi:hypothetical protein
VYFIQVTLAARLVHELPDTFIQGTFDYEVRTSAKGGTDTLIIE